MSIWRLQCSWQYHSVNARDKVVITPHFEILNPAPDIQQLCEDMVTGLQTITNHVGEVQVKGYDAQGSIPVYPQGDAIVNKGIPQLVQHPGELAHCLSFYGGRNVKRQRGRVYLPLYLLGLGASGVRPTHPIAKVDQVAELFKGLGGVDVDWVVYSRLLDRAFPVTNYWYDDEWDVQRSRGLRGSKRTVGTTTEAGTFETATYPLDQSAA